MIKIILILWLIVLHAFAFLAMWDSDLPFRIDRKLEVGLINPREITYLYEDMLGSHLQLDGSVEDGSVIFLGDSLTQGLNVAAVTHPAINYGIGMDTSFGLLQRISRYDSLKRASTIVIAIGVNDFLRTHRSPTDVLKNYEKILDSLPPTVNVIMQAVFPADERVGLAGLNVKITQFNALLLSLAKQRGHVFIQQQEAMVDKDGNLKQILHVGDGLHLSTRGYQFWIEALNRYITSGSN